MTIVVQARTIRRREAPRRRAIKCAIKAGITPFRERNRLRRLLFGL